MKLGITYQLGNIFFDLYERFEQATVNASYTRSFESRNKTETFAIRVMKFVNILRRPRQYISPAFVTSQRGGDW